MRRLWKYMLSTNERGYNLIEILTVASILGILITVPVASMRQAKAKTNEVQAIAALNVMAVAYENYNNDSRPHRYPHYLQSGVLYDNLIDFTSAEDLWRDLIRRGFIPRRFSGHPHGEPNLLAPGFSLSIFPFSVTPSFSASPRYSYIIAMEPFPGSQQPRAIAIFQGDSFGLNHVSPRARKIPGTMDYGDAKFYTYRDF